MIIELNDAMTACSSRRGIRMNDGPQDLKPTSKHVLGDNTSSAPPARGRGVCGRPWDASCECKSLCGHAAQAQVLFSFAIAIASAAVSCAFFPAGCDGVPGLNSPGARVASATAAHGRCADDGATGDHHRPVAPQARRHHVCAAPPALHLGRSSSRALAA